MDHAEFWGIVGDLSLQPLSDAQVAALENLAVMREANSQCLLTSELFRICDLGLVQTIGWGQPKGSTMVATRLLLSIHAAGRLPELLRAGRGQCA